MTNKELKRLFMEAISAESWDAYLASCSCSNAFLNFSGTDEQYAAYVTDALQNIWYASHLDAKKLISDSGLSMAKLADRFLIPYRTVQDWCSGARTPPLYVLAALAELCGLVTFDREPLPGK